MSLAPSPVVQQSPVAAAAPALLLEAVRARIAKGNVPVPLLPQIASQVLQLAGNPNSDASQLSALIHKDPALAAQVLKVANSAAYQPKMPIVSLQQAVARLGMQTMTEIALAASIGSGVFKVPGFEAFLKSLWISSVATSLFAKEVARARRLNVESAFLCGLLHDMGRPVVLQLGVAEATARRLPMTDNLRAETIAIADSLGLAVFDQVALAWKLPDAVRTAVIFQNEPAKAGAFLKEAAITAAARQLARWSATPEAEAPHEHESFALLNLYRDQIDALMAKADQVKDALKSLVGA